MLVQSDRRQNLKEIKEVLAARLRKTITNYQLPIIMDEISTESADKRKAITERLLNSSTIDDPTEARELLRDLEANLPITVRFNEYGLLNLQEQGSSLEDTHGIFQADDVFYMGDMAGILCGIEREVDSEKEVLLISITHLKVDPNHPLAKRIQQYQKKRVISMMIADGLTKRGGVRAKRQKRGFGR